MGGATQDRMPVRQAIQGLAAGLTWTVGSGSGTGTAPLSAVK